MIGEFRLSMAALDVVTAQLGIDIRQTPLTVPYFGELPDERASIEAAVWAELEQRGLARARRPDPDVEAALRLTASAESVIVIMGVDQGHSVDARLSAAGRRAVLAIQEDQHVLFRVIPAEAFTRAAVEMISQQPAGLGQSVTVTSAAAPARREDDNDARTFARSVRSQTGADAQTRTAQRIFELPRTGAGSYLVRVRDQLGRERAAPALSWLDTEHGRYLTQCHPDRGEGLTRTTIMPADDARIFQQLNQLLAGLRN